MPATTSTPLPLGGGQEQSALKHAAAAAITTNDKEKQYCFCFVAYYYCVVDILIDLHFSRPSLSVLFRIYMSHARNGVALSMVFALFSAVLNVWYTIENLNLLLTQAKYILICRYLTTRGRFSLKDIAVMVTRTLSLSLALFLEFTVTVHL